jgi:hypothetical protein
MNDSLSLHHRIPTASSPTATKAGGTNIHLHLLKLNNQNNQNNEGLLQEMINLLSILAGSGDNSEIYSLFGIPEGDLPTILYHFGLLISKYITSTNLLSKQPYNALDWKILKILSTCAIDSNEKEAFIEFLNLSQVQIEFENILIYLQELLKVEKTRFETSPYQTTICKVDCSKILSFGKKYQQKLYLQLLASYWRKISSYIDEQSGQRIKKEKRQRSIGENQEGEGEGEGESGKTEESGLKRQDSFDLYTGGRTVEDDDQDEDEEEKLLEEEDTMDFRLSMLFFFHIVKQISSQLTWKYLPVALSTFFEEIQDLFHFQRPSAADLLQPLLRKSIRITSSAASAVSSSFSSSFDEAMEEDEEEERRRKADENERNREYLHKIEELLWEPPIVEEGEIGEEGEERREEKRIKENRHILLQFYKKEKEQLTIVFNELEARHFHYHGTPTPSPSEEATPPAATTAGNNRWGSMRGSSKEGIESQEVDQEDALSSSKALRRRSYSVQQMTEQLDEIMQIKRSRRNSLESFIPYSNPSVEDTDVSQQQQQGQRPQSIRRDRSYNSAPDNSNRRNSIGRKSVSFSVANNNNNNNNNNNGNSNSNSSNNNNNNGVSSDDRGEPIRTDSNDSSLDSTTTASYTPVSSPSEALEKIQVYLQNIAKANQLIISLIKNDSKSFTEMINNSSHSTRDHGQQQPTEAGGGGISNGFPSWRSSLRVQLGNTALEPSVIPSNNYHILHIIYLFDEYINKYLLLLAQEGQTLQDENTGSFFPLYDELLRYHPQYYTLYPLTSVTSPTASPCPSPSKILLHHFYDIFDPLFFFAFNSNMLSDKTTTPTNAVLSGSTVPAVAVSSSSIAALSGSITWWSMHQQYYLHRYSSIKHFYPKEFLLSPLITPTPSHASSLKVARGGGASTLASTLTSTVAGGAGAGTGTVGGVAGTGTVVAANGRKHLTVIKPFDDFITCLEKYFEGITNENNNRST